MAVTTAHHERLRSLEPYEFELFIAELWSRRGWETEASQQSVDKGIDVIATRSTPFREKQVIQAKRYDEGNNVGSRDIQQYSSLRHQEQDADTVVVVTTSGFTRQAQELAGDLNVKLLDGDSLSRLIDEVGAVDLVDTYVGPMNVSQTEPVDSTPTEKPTTFEEDEMSTDEAVVAVLQLLLILGVVGYVLFEVATIFFL
ncbi:restriction endonuclease [Haloprofundus halophilus]|uniref:restriction endonuclease n=1 Tax=Haloprofundus halophilus TaxID=2283527 RepID=UPI000E44E126|nr:restriction endonuclease [Haloprofundus halophilus]